MSRAPVPWINIGIDVAQRVDFSALIACELGKRPVPQLPDKEETTWTARRIIQFPSGLRYDAQWPKMAETVLGIQEYWQGRSRWSRTAVGKRIRVFIDATGVGRGPADALRSLLAGTGIQVVYVTFTSGDVEDASPRGETRLGKLAMVSRAIVRFQQERISLPDTPTARLLIQQLADYEVTTRESDGHMSFGGKRLHDDLVIALSLATHWEAPRSNRLVVMQWP